MRQRNEDRLRYLLTQECAKIMANEGIKDFKTAKRKAASRLGVTNRTLLPSNIEIEQALIEYQRLFKADEQPLRLHRLRQAATEAMNFMAPFQPRLVGPVLHGTADDHEINLHVFADTAEEVMMFLMERNVPFETSERRLRVGPRDYTYFPTIGFGAGDFSIDVTVFSQQEARSAPRSPVDGRPMRRADLKEVKALLRTQEQ